MTGGVNKTRAKERPFLLGNTRNRIWSEFVDYVISFSHLVPQENRLPENNVVVRFP